MLKKCSSSTSCSQKSWPRPSACRKGTARRSGSVGEGCKLFGCIIFFCPPSARPAFVLLAPSAVFPRDRSLSRSPTHFKKKMRLKNAQIHLKFVLLGDHGEGFGEHGDFSHGASVFEESVKVPMVFFDVAAGRSFDVAFGTNPLFSGKSAL